MNLYDYFKENIHMNRIKEFNGDMYELAIVRYVMREASRIFYRDYTFFLNKENIADRDSIYNKKICLSNVKDFSIVCKSYCDVIKELLQLYGIDSNPLSASNDKFRHVDLMITTKTGNKYIVDPLTDLIEMQTGMRTNNFASKEYYEITYTKKLDSVSFLTEKELEKIDNKIGYKNGSMYLNENLNNLKMKFEHLEEFLKEDPHIAATLLGNEYDGKPLSDSEKVDLKLKYIIKYLNNRKYLNGFVDLVIFSDIVIKKIFSVEEQKQIRTRSFFVDETDLQNTELSNILTGIGARKRGMVINSGRKNYIFSLSPDTLEYDDSKWQELVKKNNIFVRPKYPINLLKYLKINGADRNILHNNEFLRLFNKFESTLLNSGYSLEDIKNNNIFIKDGIILTRFGDKYIAYKIENEHLVVSDYKKNLEYIVFYEDEGRNIFYETKPIFKDTKKIEEPNISRND